MPKFPRLLLDADVIIYSHELGIWHQLIEKCTVTVTSAVSDKEVLYWRDERDTPHQIDLNEQKEKVKSVNVSLSHFKAFNDKFGPTYLDRMDLGEAESLAYLYHSDEKWRLCSADGIVFKTLGCLNLGEQGISLEEVLKGIGLNRKFDEQHQHYTKSYRLSLTRLGAQEGLTGMAFPL